MKRRANQLEWDTPKTKRSFAAESIMATPQEPFQDYIVSNYHGITTYKLGLINSIFISNNLIIKRITKFITFSRMPYLKGLFAATVLNLSARQSTVSASEMDKYVVKSVIVKIVTTKHQKDKF